MKTHRLFFPILAGLCSAALFCACNDSTDPVPGKEPEPPTPEALVNAYEYDGVKSEIASVVQEWIDGAEYVILSPEKNIAGADELIGSDKEHVMFVFPNGIDTKETDLAVEGVDVYYYASGGKLLFKAIGTNRSDITAGTLKGSETDKDNAVFDFSITQASEAVFRGNFKASLAVERPSGPKNWVAFGEEKLEMKSVFVESVGDYKIMNMTPAEGVTSFEQIMDNDYDCFQVSLVPELLNKSLDVITETGDFEIISMFQDSEVMIESGSAEGVESGTCLFSIEGTTAKISVNLVLEDGSTLSAEGSCEVAPEPESAEYISLNGVKKDVGAAYIEDFPQSSRIYFSPERIDYFWEIIAPEYYVCFQFDKTLADGTVKDINAQPYDRLFSFEILNKKGANIFIGTERLNGASGTFCIKKDEAIDRVFSVELHITFDDGTKFDLKFNDQCTPTNDSTENQPNQYSDNGQTLPINSVIIDKSNADLYEVWVSSENGITSVEEMQKYAPVKFTVPQSYFNQGGRIFDMNKDLSISSGTRKFNRANGSKGGVMALLDGTQLTLDFTADDILKGHYSGPATIKYSNQ